MMEEGQNQDELPLKRRVRYEDEEDRISRLPDCLLVEILSRLPDTKYAVRTGVLSKRWKHIWNWVPNLIFSNNGYLSTDFVSFVDKTLTQHAQLKLKKFSVRCHHDIQFDSHINNWIHYAINCNVEDFNLYLWKWQPEADFRLDQSIFINSCFTDLKLAGCTLNPIGPISWKNLLSLHLSHVELDEDLIGNIVSGSPVLETLVLEDCHGYRQLNITSKSVKKLVLHGYGFSEDLDEDFADVIEVNAPNILSLAIQDDLLWLEILLVNVSSLVEAELDFRKLELYDKTDYRAEENMLKGFIINLSHVKELNIGISCAWALFRLEAKGFVRPSNLKVCDTSSCHFYSVDDYDDDDDYNYDNDEDDEDDDYDNDDEEC